MHFANLFRTGNFSGPDGPDWFIGNDEIRRAETPAAGMFIIDQAELLIGGLEKPESTAHLLGLWLHHHQTYHRPSHRALAYL